MKRLVFGLGLFLTSCTLGPFDASPEDVCDFIDHYADCSVVGACDECETYWYYGPGVDEWEKFTVHKSLRLWLGEL